MSTPRRSSVIVLAAGLIALAILVGGAAWFVFDVREQPDAAPIVESSTSANVESPAPALTEPDREPAHAPVESAPVERTLSPSETPPFGDLFALLTWLETEGHGPLAEVVGDAAGFEALFASQNRERWVEGRPYVKKLGETWSAGMTIALEPGVWKLENVLPSDGLLPADITLSGSGLTRTLLVIDGLRPRGRVERFTLRDCTVFTDNQALLDCRGDFVALTVERVRLVGFDSGQAPSPLVRARGLGMQMRDCELLGGYGRAPGSGSLFDVPSAAVLVRFDRCRFEALRFGLASAHVNVSLAFVESTTNALIEDPAAELVSRTGVSFASTPLVLLPRGQRPPSLALEGLFANWRALSK